MAGKAEMEKESVLELIRKCLALGNSPNENEANAAMAKTQELLTKYNIDMATFRVGANDDEQEMVNLSINKDLLGLSWIAVLLNTLAINNYCHVIRITGSGGNLHILGKLANVEAVFEMYNWVLPQIIRLSENSGFKRSAKTSYARGVINRLGERMRESKQTFKQNNPSSTALVLAVQEESDRFYAEIFPGARNGAKRRYDFGAYSKGQSDGNKVSLRASNHLSNGRLMLKYQQ